VAEIPSVFDAGTFDPATLDTTTTEVPPVEPPVVPPAVIDPQATVFDVTTFDVPVFDVTVFDIPVFDAVEVAPVITKIAVPKEMVVAELGSTVAIFAHIYSYGSSSASAVPLNLTVLPEIQVYDPYDAADLDFQSMERVDDGVYRYQYVIPRSGWRGAYSARVRASNGLMETLSKKAVVFTIHE
jgi:hypothetical protein